MTAASLDKSTPPGRPYTAGMNALLTHDGNWLVRDPQTGITVSRHTLPEAPAELRRLLAHRRADARRAPPAHEGVAA